MSFQDVGKGQAARGRASSTNNGYSISSGANGDFSVPGQRRSSAAALQQRQGRGGGGGGFGSAGPLRTGGVGVGSRMPQGSYGRDASGVHQGGLGEPIRSGVAAGVGRSGGSSGGGKVGDYLMIYSQNVTILHRMVQQLGTTRDTTELRGQCRCQIDVIGELRGKIQTELREQEQEAEGASRQDAARLGAMNTKLTKDYNRVNAIALDLATQAERRMREVDTQRQLQNEADEERAKVAFSGAGAGRQEGMLEVQQRRERVQMQEEAINTAIIQETEEELQQINKSLYKVNEIYRDLANMVEQQQEAVEQIEGNTEGAHARAQEGLVQVQKASDYQPSCTIS